MKYLLIVAMLAVVGCSSNSKKDEKAEEPQKQETVVEEGAEENKDEANAESDENKSEEKKEDSGNQQTAELNGENGGEDSEGFAPVEGVVTLTISCKLNQDERTMTVTRAEGKTPLCGVAYEKFGKTKTVAIANNDENYCSQVANQIKDSLTSANFECTGGSESSTPAAAEKAEASEEATTESSEEAKN